MKFKNTTTNTIANSANNNQTQHSHPPSIYSYVRFSTLEQAKGKSLERQTAFARKVARERGLELDESLTIKDLGKSGYHQDNIKSGALGAFLEVVNNGQVPTGSILVIESLDRISRAEPLTAQGVISQIINSGITVITAIDNKEYSRQSLKENSMDIIYIILVFIRAHEESQAKSARAIGTIVAKCRDWVAGKRGFKIDCGRPPKWLKWCKNGNEFVFIEREKEIILRKIELFQTGHGGLKIAELLNDEFGDGTVHYTGANIYKEVRRRNLDGENEIDVNGEKYLLDEYYPPLLTEFEFNNLLSCTKHRAASKHSQKFIGILAGAQVFRCEQCGGTMKSHVIYRNKNVENVKESHKVYRCTEASRSKTSANCQRQSKTDPLYC
jgi:DNA invertase Pin-like site-specific DNA recombinase